MSEPVGWNVYCTTRDLRGEEHHAFREFIPNEPELDAAAERMSAEIEKWAAAHPRRCGAVLFPLPRDLLTDFVIWAGEPVHPDIAARCGHVQGPAPAVCAREPHPEGTWHWNKGTWWR